MVVLCCCLSSGLIPGSALQGVTLGGFGGTYGVPGIEFSKASSLHTPTPWGVFANVNSLSLLNAANPSPGDQGVPGCRPEGPREPRADWSSTVCLGQDMGFHLGPVWPPTKTLGELLSVGNAGGWV